MISQMKNIEKKNKAVGTVQQPNRKIGERDQIHSNVVV
jgi:hypothetical protein